jgi:hypothetical protein
MLTHLHEKSKVLERKILKNESICNGRNNGWMYAVGHVWFAM